MQVFVVALPRGIGQLQFVTFLVYSLGNLLGGGVHNPHDLERVALDVRAAGHAAAAIGRSVASPLVIDPVTEDRPLSVVVAVQGGALKTQVLPEQVAADD